MRTRRCLCGIKIALSAVNDVKEREEGGRWMRCLVVVDIAAVDNTTETMVVTLRMSETWYWVKS